MRKEEDRKKMKQQTDSELEKVAAEMTHSLKLAPWPLDEAVGDICACDKCWFRTSVEPGLFDDIVKEDVDDDRCTNFQCWEIKKQKWLEIQKVNKMETAKFRLMCYKPKLDGHLIDNGIGYYTYTVNTLFNPSKIKLNIFQRAKLFKKLLCSHSESWWPDNGSFYYKIETIMGDSKVVDGQMFTSTMGQTGGKNRKGDGIVIRPADQVLKHPLRWYYYEIEVPKAALEYAIEWAWEMRENNTGYDKKDIKTFFNPFENKRVQDLTDGQGICSGVVWGFVYKIWEWIRDNVSQFKKLPSNNIWFDQFNIWFDQFCKLTHLGDRIIENLPSPLLLSIWAYMAGYIPREVINGEPVRLIK